MHIVVNVQIFINVEHHINHTIAINIHKVDQWNIGTRIRLLLWLDQMPKLLRISLFLQTKFLLSFVQLLNVNFVIIFINGLPNHISFFLLFL